MAKLKKAPNFKKWTSSYIFSVKDFDGDDDTSDSTVQYTYGLSLSPEARQLGEEYRILSQAIEKEDGNFLFNYFASPGSKEIRVEHDSPTDCYWIELQKYYAGEKWGVAYEFLIQTWDFDKKHYISSENTQSYSFYLAEYPFLLADALPLFNALSFDNTTHLIRLHQMWNRLRQISNRAFVYDAIPSGYKKLFIPKEKVKLRDMSEKEVAHLICDINAFGHDYQIKRDDYFKDLVELKKETKAFSYYYKNAFEAYLGRILGEFIYRLFQEKIIKQCDYCWNVFKYDEHKRYCSEKDGDNCGQIVRNRRFYKKHRKTLLPKARQTTRGLRQLYKKHGVKK